MSAFNVRVGTLVTEEEDMSIVTPAPVELADCEGDAFALDLEPSTEGVYRSPQWVETLKVASITSETI